MLQSEAGECGLVCLAMIASHHGLRIDLPELRKRFALSLKGATLDQLMRHAEALGFNTRAIRCEPAELTLLLRPCILHWDLSHFVVLEKIGRSDAFIVDPATGRRRVATAQFSRHFTGVVLEVVPAASFVPADLRRRIRLRHLAGRVIGLKRALVHLVALAAGLEVVALCTPAVMQIVVDGALVTGDRDLLALAVVGGALLLVAEFTLRMFRGWVAVQLHQQWSTQWAANLFAHLLRLPIAFFEKRHLGDIASRFASLAAIRTTLASGAVNAVVDGVLALVTFVLMAIYSGRLAAVAAVAVLLYALLRLAAYRPFREASEERIVLAARENTCFLESIRALLPLKLYGRVAERVGRWHNLMIDVQNRDVATQRMTLWFTSSNALIAGTEGMLLLYLGGIAVLDRSLTLGALLAVLAYRAQFGERASRLIDLAIDLRMLGLHAERLADIALAEPEAQQGAAGDATALVPRLELRDLSFRHGDGEPWVLRHVDLVVEAGESLAIVGASGCGKTTLMKLMLGLYVPVEGEILVGAFGAAVPLRLLDSSSYRALLATVMQDDVLLAGSLADNIACFDPEPRRERIEVAARRAAVHDDIVAMPMGYHTQVGEMGSTLSGGQKQRVLLARALYKQPRMLFLDEATSHLDVAAEREVNAAIRALALTRVTIAHRPETIASADRVVTLEKGRITHDVRVQDMPAPCRSIFPAGGRPGIERE